MPDKPFTRYPPNIRWTGVLREILGSEFEIIEEGQNGRTTVWDDPYGDHKNGKTYLPPCLESHCELDLVIIMLGTNDLKAHFRLTAADVAQGLKALGSLVKSSGAGRGGMPPELLIVAPPPIGHLSLLAGVYGDAPEKSKQLAEQIELISRFCGYHFMDSGKIVTSSPVDGVHWEAEQHKRFALAISDRIRSLLPPRR